MRAWNKKRKPKHHSKVKWRVYYFFKRCLVTEVKSRTHKKITEVYKPLEHSRKLLKIKRNITRNAKAKILRGN